MSDTIKVSEIEAFAMGELARAAKAEGVSRELKAEWAFGIALMLRSMKHYEAAERIEAERAKVFSWSEHIDRAKEGEQ